MIDCNDEMSSSTLKPACIGELQLLGAESEAILESWFIKIVVGDDLIIGRDKTKCQWTFDDLYLSARHLRLYTITYDDEENCMNEHLVYAEDLSRNGTFWNESLIGKGNGGYLLSDQDRLRLSSKTIFRFVVPETLSSFEYFDLTQEKEMTQFRNEYVISDRLLGAGSFGRVFMAIEQHSRTQLACKVVDLRKLRNTKSGHFSTSKIAPVVARKDLHSKNPTDEKCSNKRVLEQVKELLRTYYREVEILSHLKHANIIGLEKVFVTDYTIYMFMELVTAGDLFSYLESQNGALPEVECAAILRQILIALRFLHGRDIAHRDLKPENIMMTSLSSGCRVVLTDFGTATRFNSNRRVTTVIGSDQYAAPEVKMNGKDNAARTGYTKAVDMWSVGAITVVLLTGFSAFTDAASGLFSPLLAQKCDLTYLEGSHEWQRISARPKDFIANLLLLDTVKRLTAEKALRHPWFCNEFHKTDFEELYKRTIKNWRPRQAKIPIVEHFNSTIISKLVISPGNSAPLKRRRSRRTPVESHCKPFARNMHILLWPEQKSAGKQTMSKEVKFAIDEMWTKTPRTAFKARPSLPAAQHHNASVVIDDEDDDEKRDALDAAAGHHSQPKV